MRTITSLSILAAALLAAQVVQAQTSTPPRVVVFGTVNAQLESISTSNSANSALDKPSCWRISGVSLGLGVRAAVPLNETMTGLAQYVTGVSVDCVQKKVHVPWTKPTIASLPCCARTHA
jgi:hypothetical protein